MRLRLFCFPHAGGGASRFVEWSRGLPPEVEVVPVALPGREGRFGEPMPAALDELLDQVIPRLAPQLEGAFAFLGHSMGALIAFELARRLRAQAAPQPFYLFVSGFRAPHLPERKRPLHNLPDPLLLAELKRLDGTPAALLNDDEVVKLVLPALRADLALCEKYKYRSQEPLECPISCFGGLRDRRIGRTQLAGWARHTRGGFRLRMFPGGHFFVFESQPLVQLAVCADLASLPRRLAQFAASAASGRS